MARSPKPILSDAEAVDWELEQDAQKEPDTVAVPPDNVDPVGQLPLDASIMIEGKSCLVIDVQVWRDSETGEQAVEELGCSVFPPKLVVNF